MNLNKNIESEATLEKNDLSLKEIYFLLIKNIYSIFLIILVITSLTILLTLLSKSKYKSTGSIIINNPQNAMSIFELDIANNNNYLENEMEVINSRSTARMTIDNLLNSDYRNDLLLFNTKKYQSDGVKSILRKFFFIDYLTNNIDMNLNNVEDVSDSLYNVFVNNFSESLLIENKRLTDVLKLSIISSDPEESALLINTLIDVYMERDLKWTVGEISHLKKFLNEQLVIVEKELKDTEDKFKKFQEEESFFGLDENFSPLLENLNTIESEYYTITAEKNILDVRKKYILNQLNEDEKKTVDAAVRTIDQRLLALKSEIANYEKELISTLAQQGNNHPAYKSLENKLDILKEKLRKEMKMLIDEGVIVSNPILFRQNMMDTLVTIESNLSILESKGSEFKKIISEYEVKLQSLPIKVLEFSRLERIKNIQSQTYSLMRQKLEEAKINEASKLGKVRIVDRAIPNYVKVSPNLKLNSLLGLFLGLLVAVGYIGIKELFDNSIKSIEQLERRSLYILAIIPDINVKAGLNRKSKKYISLNKNVKSLQRRLITHEDPKSPISESYRSLRTSLLYTNTKKKDKSSVILVSSPGPGEGKTTTIANLAITYANLGKKTILLDTDLRKPVLHNVFKFDKSPGVTSYLSGIDNNLDKIVYKTDIENLSIISSGVIPPNPSELLNVDKMVKLLEDLKKQYDIILFDTPPLLAVTDPYVLMKHVDHTVIVVRAGITQKLGLERVLTSIRNRGFKETGIVFNGINETNSYGSGYYYNYYQYYYSENQT